MFTIQGHLQEAKGTTTFVHACKTQNCQESLLAEDDMKYLSTRHGSVKTDNSVDLCAVKPLLLVAPPPDLEKYLSDLGLERRQYLLEQGKA